MADTITVFARVLDPPQKPVVTGSDTCVNGGPAIQLDWADDINSVSYDIVRDGLLVTTGVVASTYTDTAVIRGQTYSYTVTALGPMGPGFSDADPVTVSVPTTCTSTSIPSLSIQTFAGKTIIGTSNRHFTTDRNPRFTGSTNLLNARIDIRAVSNHETITATVFANAAGYFEWSYSGKLDTDDYNVTFTATDTLDPTLSVAELIKIGIEKEFIEDKKQSKPVAVAMNDPLSETLVQTPSMLDISVILSGRELYAGDTVFATLQIGTVPSHLAGKSATVTLSILDGEGRVIDESTEEIRAQSGFEWKRGFRVPSSMVGREYHVVGELALLEYAVSREESFRVLELPLFTIGGSTVTYEGVVSNIGWVSFILLFFFLWWLLLFVREYYLYSQSRRHIWGKDLHSAGYF